MTVKKPRVLYLSYTGMLEPLGRSQVLSYLSRLSDEYQFDVISFEKAHDLSDSANVAAMRKDFSRWDIRWRPRRYHSRPRLLATAWDIFTLLICTLVFSVRYRPSHVHCRSYIPAMVGWLNSKITGVPYIFDMRAIWPEELVTAGRLDPGSTLYRCIRWIERRLLNNAAHAVSLTEAAVDKLLSSYTELQRDDFTVITTCVDISRFSVSEHLKNSCVFPEQPVVGTMGTLLSGWFYLDAFFNFFRVIKTMRPGARAFIVTRDDHASVREIAQNSGLDISDVDIMASDPLDIPENLAKMDMAVMFYAPDTGRAPTRLAEFLAAGVPVIGNEGVGDLARIIRSSGVGSVVKNAYCENELELVAKEFIEAYPSITGQGNCRRAAESCFSADHGSSQYRTIYRTVSDSQAVA